MKKFHKNSCNSFRFQRKNKATIHEFFKEISKIKNTYIFAALPQDEVVHQELNSNVMVMSLELFHGSHMRVTSRCYFSYYSYFAHLSYRYNVHIFLRLTLIGTWLHEFNSESSWITSMSIITQPPTLLIEKYDGGSRLR